MKNVKIPEAYADLFKGKALAYLATVSPQGRPMVTPVWVDREGDLILINSEQKRGKDRNMARNAKVAMAIMDPAQPFRYLGIQGEVAEVRVQGGKEHADKLSQRYLGKSEYPFLKPGDVRQVWVIRPTAVRAQG